MEVFVVVFASSVKSVESRYRDLNGTGGRFLTNSDRLIWPQSSWN